MKELCVVFELWHLGDGNYPPLHKNQKVNFAFQFQPYEDTISDSQDYFFKQVKDAEYEFGGEIIRDYCDEETRLLIVDTKGFLFYIEHAQKDGQSLAGQFIRGKGQLLLDYYIWAGYLDNYENAPDIFYSYLVDKIREVKIPERFIHRSEHGYSAPTSLSTDDYEEGDTKEIEDMLTRGTDVSFFLLDLHLIDELFLKRSHN